MAKFPFQRVLVPVPSPTATLKAYLSLLCDPPILCHFVQVVPARPSQPVDAQALQNKIEETFGGLAETVVIRRGDQLNELLSHAAEMHADLLLVGHQPASSKQRVLARRLAMKAPCSLWMIPEDTPTSLSNILVPVDFSARSADALRTAV